MSDAATLTETPQQADRAVTIYEKSVPGRRAAQLLARRRVLCGHPGLIVRAVRFRVRTIDAVGPAAVVFDNFISDFRHV